MKKYYLCFALAVLLLLFSCSSRRVYSEERLLLGTIVRVSVICDNAAFARGALDSAFGEIGRIEKMISFYDESSDVSRINASRGWVAVGDETFALIRKCRELSVNSKGAFDISFAGAGDLWKFGDKFAVPDSSAVRARLGLVNFRNIILDGKNKRVRLARTGMKIGLGSIGKRYAIGCAVRKLREYGITDGLVLTGGDLQAMGSKFGRPWMVGVKNPRGDGVLYEFPVSPGETVSTSGDYERCQIVNGRRYHHIMDPRTGYPAETFASVTVITDIPENADGLSTALFVSGKSSFRQLLSLYPSTYVIIIDLDMRVYASKELKAKLKPSSDNSPKIEWI